MKTKIDIGELGTNYSVLNRDSGKISEIKVIEYSELDQILNQIIIPEIGFQKNLNLIIQRLSGHYPSPYHISWHVTTVDTYQIENAVIQAKIEGNNVVVVEFID